MSIYRSKIQFGRYNIVGTTVKDSSNIPKDLAADEKHGWISGEKIYAAITVGENCYLGASISPTASEKDLTEAYGQFKSEVRSVNPHYAPDTVNTDGWFATMNAWLNNFVNIVIIGCFLHAVLKIRNVCTKATKDLYNEIAEKVWLVLSIRE